MPYAATDFIISKSKKIMKTLIELYDERPIENVLASEVFRPETTVFLCPAAIAQDKALQKKMRDYYSHMKLPCKLVFLESSMYDSSKLLRQLQKVEDEYPECVLDITGGTDAALFACGMLCEKNGTSAFTYSRKRECFFEIHNAPFANELPCTVTHKVEDCFMMAGGALRKGRVDNKILSSYIDTFDKFFSCYLRYRAEWNKAVKYIQVVSQNARGTSSLTVNTAKKVKGERGTMIDAPIELLRELEKIGYIKQLKVEGEKVSFSFKDQQIRTWLRDIGSVLELYVYKACLESDAFNDVVTSAVVDWDADAKSDAVTNEIDVMAMMGIVPVFISCKTCDVTTEALNELAILRDRFGGNSAKAAIVTTKTCRGITRHRASELGIDVIDLNDLKSGRIKEAIASVIT